VLARLEFCSDNIIRLCNSTQKNAEKLKYYGKQVSTCNIMTNQDDKESLQIDEEMTVGSYMI